MGSGDNVGCVVGRLRDGLDVGRGSVLSGDGGRVVRRGAFYQGLVVRMERRAHSLVGSITTLLVGAD